MARRKKPLIDDGLRLRILETFARDRNLTFVEIADIVSGPDCQVTPGAVLDVLHQADLAGSTMTANPKEAIDNAITVMQSVAAHADPGGVLAISTEAIVAGIREQRSRIGPTMPTREITGLIDSWVAVYDRALEAYTINVMADAIRMRSGPAVDAEVRASVEPTKRIAQSAAHRYAQATGAFDPGKAIETEGEET